MPSYVIVGASRGIGLGFVQKLAADSSNTVIGLVRDPSSVKPVPNATFLQGDLTDAASLNAAAQKITTLTPDGAIDHLIINGAYLSESTQFTTPTEFTGKEAFFLSEMQTFMSTNVAGVLFSINAFLPLLRQSSIKKVVVISSGHADIELIEKAETAGAVLYAISKGAANLLIAKYAVELKDEEIKFLALSPGVVSTKDNDPAQFSPEEQAKFAKMVAGFAKMFPNFTGPISIEQSVEMQLKVIHGLTQEQSGQFLSHLGSKQWL